VQNILQQKNNDKQMKLVLKDGEFAGTCASQNPMLNTEGEACGFCGKTPDQFENCSEPQHS